MNAIERVSSIWRDLVRRHRCEGAAADRTLDDLLRAYAQPHRHYHTLDHIADLLQLQEQHGRASGSDAVSLAILFHDAVYDPSRGDNEAASSDLARDQMASLGLPEALIGKVQRYIRATAHGATPPSADDADLDLLLDLDLSVLAAPPDRYRAYAQAIRREYAAVPETRYRSGRRAVLEGFLARPQIYRTATLRALWEPRARANLANEIASLQ